MPIGLTSADTNGVYGITPAPAAWSSVTPYLLGNSVTYGGLMWEAVAPSTDVTPGSDDTKWSVSILGLVVSNDLALSAAITAVGPGPQGAAGGPGRRGRIGFQGFQGYQGTEGAQGLQGLQGYQGTEGLQGYQGAQGYQGSIGFSGAQGYQGNQGYQGSAGGPGRRGNIGFQGFQGYQGNQGNQGLGGAQGLQGLQGLQGPIGHQGFQGYQGPIGHQGFQGYQGYQGGTGNQGYQGATPTGPYLPLAGGTMSGPINMGSESITAVAELEAATLAGSGGGDATFAAGALFQGDVTIGTSDHINFKDSTGTIQLFAQLYVDNNVYLDTPGGFRLRTASQANTNLTLNSDGTSLFGGAVKLAGNALDLDGSSSIKADGSGNVTILSPAITVGTSYTDSITFESTVIFASGTYNGVFYYSQLYRPYLSAGLAPASSSASGEIGEIEWDTNYFYVCVAANTWKRIALSTF